MEKEIININNKTIVNINSKEERIFDYKSSVEFFLDINYNNNTFNIVVNREIFSKEFFNLKTNLFERLFKNLKEYNINIVILGDYKSYTKEFLNYIYSTNEQSEFYFLENLKEAIYVLK